MSPSSYFAAKLQIEFRAFQEILVWGMGKAERISGWRGNVKESTNFTNKVDTHLTIKKLFRNR